jgi:hypothetical protein
MGRFKVILDASFTVTFPNGWEFTVPFWAVGLAGVALVAVFAALAIRIAVRLVNRRDDPNRAKRPPDAP